MLQEQGANYFLDVGLGDGIPLDFYVGLISANFTEGSTFTNASIGGAITELTGYTASTRLAYSVAAASAGSVANTAPLVFTLNADATAYGYFVISSSAKSAATGVLLQVKKFTTALTRLSGQDITIDANTLTLANAV